MNKRVKQVSRKSLTMFVITLLLTSIFVVLIESPQAQALSSYGKTDIGSTTYDVGNLFHFAFRIVIPDDITAKAIVWYCNSSGTSDMYMAIRNATEDGLYVENITAIVVSSATRPANSSLSWTAFNITDTVLTAGTYYVEPIYTWGAIEASGCHFMYDTTGGRTIIGSGSNYTNPYLPFTGTAYQWSVSVYIDGEPLNTVEPDASAKENSDYVLHENDGTYYVYEVSSSTNVYSSSNTTLAFEEACEYSTGKNLTIESGNYTASPRFTVSYENINFRGDGTVWLLAPDWSNESVVFLDHAHGCSMLDINIDGNKANQKVPLPSEDINGITLSYTDDTIFDNLTLTNCKRSGIENFDSDRMLIQNSLITYNGWNGITLGGGSDNCTVENNEVTFSSDVGISIYATNCIVKNNYVHNCTTMDGSPKWAGAEELNNSHWGIGVEDDGTGSYIYNNAVFDCPAMGIVVGGSGTNVTVASNNIIRTATGIGIDNGGSNIVYKNNVTDWSYTEDPFYYGRSAAIDVVDSPNTNITENILISTDTTESIGLHTSVDDLESTQIIFSDNVITSSTSPLAWNGIALKITKSSGSTFARNQLQATSGMDFGSGCEENFVYDNDFSNCTTATFDMNSQPYFWNNTALASDGYYMLNASIVGSGSTTINTVESSSDSLGHQFKANTNVSVTWTPDAGNIRVDFAIDGSNQSSTVSPYDVIMSSDREVMVYFMEGEDSYVAVASWVSPLAQQYNSSTVNFEVSTVGGNETGVTLQIQLYNESVAVYPENFTSASGSFTGLTNGTYTAAVYAVGEHGASDYETVTFTVAIADVYTLTVSITSPANTTYTSGIVAYSVSSSGNETGVTYQINAYLNSVAVGSNKTAVSGTFIGLSNGTYTFAVYAVGTHGTETYETVVFTVSITTSEDAPVLTIVSPFNRTYITSTFNVEITYTGTAALIWFNVKNGSSWVYESNTTYTAATSLTGYADGTYTFYAFAINNEGETDEESTVFTVGIIANPILPQVNVDTYWLFLQEGDFLGAVQALLVSTFLSFEAAIAMIVMLFMIPIYLRTKSLLLLSILWILIGSFFVAAVPMASGIGILFIALAIGGLLWRLFRPSGYG